MIARTLAGLGVVLVASCGFESRTIEIDAPIDAAAPVGWRLVAAGNAYSCGIRLDDTLWCWGNNAIGQLGIGRTDEHSNAPVQVGTAHWSTVAAGLAHACGVQTDGTLWCWGSNAYGQLGTDPTGTMQVATTPQLVGTAWSSVAAGDYHTCAIASDGGLACWGRNVRGELGTGDPVTPSRVPVKLAGTWTQITAGYLATCGIQSDASLWCWGFNGYGELGDGSAADKHVPTVIAATETWRDIAISYLHTCGVLADGRLHCWGYGGYGQLGDGTRASRLVPTPLVPDEAAWSRVATGTYHTCGIKTDGTVWCWGNDEHGVIATTTDQTSSLMPVQISPAGPFETIDLGSNHSCGVTADHQLWCTGEDSLGQLGSGAGGSALSPAQIPGAWSIVSTQRDTTCAQNTARELWCWGENDSGQFGDGTYTSRQLPVLALAGDRIGIGVGRDHICDVRMNNEVFCAGDNSVGALGDNTMISRATFQRVTLPAMRAIASWRRSTCAVPLAGNGLWCWGDNDYGQLGTSDKLIRLTPTQLLAGTGMIVAADVGHHHSCVVRANGTLGCTGDNTDGQLGIGAALEALVFTNVTSPVPAWRDVAAGYYHTCGLTSAGARHCWGSNVFGQFGDGTTTGGNTPRLIDAGPWQAISLGYHHGCGIKPDTSLWCWGGNARGQLGVGSFAGAMLPVQLAGTGWRSVVAGEEYTCATKTDDTLWCWGANLGGQLGDGRAWRAAWDVVREAAPP